MKKRTGKTARMRFKVTKVGALVALIITQKIKEVKLWHYPF